MSKNLHPGVKYIEGDRGKGPFIIRIGTTNEFVSDIRSGYYSRWGAPTVGVLRAVGRDNPSVRIYQSMDSALRAAGHVWRIEGLHTTIETINV